jgi:phospholipid/cholesterol/gamma-HCH transport system substrate-binding protein
VQLSFQFFLASSASFNRIDGLSEGDPVYLSGVRIGSVEKMWLNKDFRAVVTFWLKGGIELPSDSSAAIHTDGLFGSKFIVLEPGAEESFLKNGSLITFTQDAVVVSELLDLIISEGKANRAKNQSQ